MQVKGEVCGRFYTHQVVVQKPIAIKNDSLLKKVVAMAMVGLGLTAFKGVVFAQTINSLKIEDKKDSSQYTFGVITEVMPRYKHGDQAGLQRIIQQNLRNPDKINGRVVTSFIIDTTGKPIDIQILKSLSKISDQEAIRLVNLLEFEPGTQMGKKVPVRYILPIQFYDIMTPKKKQ
ncbi:hypothetical protein GCM10023183_06530 [Nibribacter koreensis]|uniref:TonB C-terminal domain-containing protein n=2 Tax=Nibribacter koreensis TaxID=1084519 RepID=A0ABP8F9E9_9BACT